MIFFQSKIGTMTSFSKALIVSRFLHCLCSYCALLYFIFSKSRPCARRKRRRPRIWQRRARGGRRWGERRARPKRKPRGVWLTPKRRARRARRTRGAPTRGFARVRPHALRLCRLRRFHFYFTFSPSCAYSAYSSLLLLLRSIFSRVSHPCNFFPFEGMLVLPRLHSNPPPRLVYHSTATRDRWGPSSVCVLGVRRDGPRRTGRSRGRTGRCRRGRRNGELRGRGAAAAHGAAAHRGHRAGAAARRGTNMLFIRRRRSHRRQHLIIMRAVSS